MFPDVKIIATLIIDTRTMNPELIHSNWVANRVPCADRVKKTLADIFRVNPFTEIELRIAGMIVFGPNPVVLNIDCRRVEYQNFHNRIAESTLLSNVWMGLAGADEISQMDIRVDLEYRHESSLPNTVAIVQDRVVSLSPA